ncbi:MAG TPA: helix-turn-helix transcriptional regulator, partial [Pseudonocardiaceae bacterium]|nr:helix-turn-helix transcriptional regulator [Pseudonocardiaceae bacterium]
EVHAPGVAPRGIGGDSARSDHVVDAADDARTIGRRLRRIRKARDKLLTVVAGLAGMSIATLSRIENGLRALDSISEILALADALRVAPSELVKLPEPAPGNEGTDAAINEVRLALLAASRGHLGGHAQLVDVLRARAASVVGAYCGCDRHGAVGAALPALIRDLHTSIAAGRDVAELLELAVLLHSHATVGWLRVVGSSLDLRSQAAELARRAAQERDTPEMLGLATWGGMYVLVMAGAADLALAELNAVTVPARTPESMQVAGVLELCRLFLAVADSRPGDAGPPLEMAAELADRTGEVNAYGLGFGPQEVGQWRARDAVEARDYERAVRIAEGLRPATHPHRSRQADYWITYGRALARIRGRHEQAVIALRRAELILPHYVQRDPITRDVIDELRFRSYKDDAVRSLADHDTHRGWLGGDGAVQALCGASRNVCFRWIIRHSWGGLGH